MHDHVARLRRLVEGRPPALPGVLDDLAERWASLPARARLAVGVGAALVLLVLSGAGAARSPWGPAVEILVATRDLPAGHVLTHEDLERASWPAALAPSTPVETTGRTLTVGLPAGTPVTADHLGDGGLSGQLHQAEAAFPLSLEGGAMLRPGQIVDLVAGDAGGGGLRLSSAARVLAVDGGTTWVAVDRDDAPGLAGAAARGQVVAVPLPPGG